jgi:hypothetical protein
LVPPSANERKTPQDARKGSLQEGKMKKFALAFLALATALAITPVALADTVVLLDNTVGGDNTTGTSVALANLGTLVYTYGPISLTPSNPGDLHPYTAYYSVSVYKGGSDALGANDLNFVYTLKNTATGSDFINLISTANFGTFTVKEGNLSPNTSPQSLIVRKASDVGGIITLDLDLANQVYAGETLDSFVLITNATQWTLGGITFDDGAAVNGYSPIAATPEPSSLMLLGSGLFGIAMLVLWKGKANRLVLHS